MFLLLLLLFLLLLVLVVLVVVVHRRRQKVVSPPDPHGCGRVEVQFLASRGGRRCMNGRRAWSA